MTTWKMPEIETSLATLRRKRGLSAINQRAKRMFITHTV
jgi:hypothetical protein